MQQHHHRPGGMLDDDVRSLHSVGSRVSNAGSAYSAATFYSFSTSNYSGFSGAGELARRQQQKRHYVHPSELDPNAHYDVDWVPDDLAMSCMSCYAEFTPFLRRKSHCRSCGRVVCSGCSRARVMVVGLRGLQKACNDCVHAAEKIRRAAACESISEDVDGGSSVASSNNSVGSNGDTHTHHRRSSNNNTTTTTTTTTTTEAARLESSELKPKENKVEGQKQQEMNAAAMTDMEDNKGKTMEQQANEGQDEAFPNSKKNTRTGKKGEGGLLSTTGLLAVGCTALAVGSVLVLNPKLLSTLVGRLGKK